MSTHFYVLRIKISEGITFETVTKILETIPTKTKDKQWEYELIEESGDSHVDFVSVFFDILNRQNLRRLAEVGIDKKSISIWLYYEYENQCNLEFSVANMKKLVDLDLSLCVSCWQK